MGSTTSVTATVIERHAGVRRASGAKRERGAEARAARPPKAALGNIASSSSASREKADRRGVRYRLRKALWRESSLERVRNCGRLPRSAGVGLRLGNGAAGFSGLETCGSVWACPVCAAKIAARRAEELREVLAWATANGHTVALFTVTMRHHMGQKLADLWDAETKAWQAVTSGRRWVRDRDSYGVLGFVRAFEVTYGVNGWHPHLHVILVLEGAVASGDVATLGHSMFSRWKAQLHREGYDVSANNGGLDIKTTAGSVDVELSRYLAKSLAMEVTHGHAKTGKNGGLTPFQIAQAVFDTGDADLLARWHEWEEVSKGRRQITWSRHLRQLAALDAEQSDEDVAAEDLGDEDLVLIDSADWWCIRDEAALLLAAAEVSLASATNWLDGRGVPYVITEAGRKCILASVAISGPTSVGCP